MPCAPRFPAAVGGACAGPVEAAAALARPEHAAPLSPGFDVQGWDRSPFARREFLSSDVVAWPSVLIEQVRSRPDVDEALLPSSRDFQIVLVLDGDAQIESFDGRRWHRAAYVPGQVSMTAPDRPSRLRWRSVDGKAPRTLHAVIPRATMTAALEQLGRPVDPGAMPDHLSSTDPVVETTLRALRRAAEEKWDPLYAESAAWHLAAHALITHPRQLHESAPPLDRRLTAVLDFVQDNLDRPLTLADLAEVAGLSPFHFARSFRSATGRTPVQHVTEVRLQRARTMLAAASLRVSDVAICCGFSTPSHFAATFRRRFGTTPTQFRASREPT